MATTRAKFKVNSIAQHEHGFRTVILFPVCDGPNGFWKYTPQGRLEMGLSKDCQAEFHPGQEFFVDFTPVEP